MGVATITPFGKELRKLRIDADEVLLNMADKLGITAAYLSSIENGKRTIPDDFIGKIAVSYNLSKKQVRDLEAAMVETQSKITVTFPKECGENREFIETALLFARDISKLDNNQLREVKKILASVDDAGTEDNQD